MTGVIVDRLSGDLDFAWTQQSLAANQVALDIETTGLDWSSATIQTVQVEESGTVALVRVDPAHRPKNLLRLLADPAVTKVFHHAAFDLRFMVSAWGATPSNVACTKVAAKIALPGRSSYSLAPLLSDIYGVRIDKSLQTSDWTGRLTDAQVEYAAGDVLHLRALLATLMDMAESNGVLNLVSASFAYLPTRVRLDLRGVRDVFTH